MKIYKSFLLAAIILLGISCKTAQPSVQNQPVVDDHKISFTFLQLNDVYEIAPLEGGEVGGMARVANLRKQLLNENPNTFTFLAGDFLNPSLLGTVKYEGKRIRGRQMVEVMNALGVDLVTFGNHEFDLSKNDLQQRLNESEFAWTSANVRQKVAGTTYPFYKERNGIKEFATDTHILEAQDADGTAIKIGLFGVLLPSNPTSYAEYTDMYEQAKRAYNSLKEKADIIFGLTHVKVEQDKKIAELLPALPLIMGGHEHNNMLVEVGKTKIAKADANAKTVYVHRIHYDKKLKTYQLISELVPINEKTGEEENVKQIVDKWNGILETQIKKIIDNPNEVIHTAQEPLDGRDKPIRSIQTNLGNLIARSMAFGFEDKVDCALVNGGSIRIDDQLSGNITSLDIFRVLPFGGGILKVEVKGSLLKEVLDYGKSRAGKGAYLQRHLVAYKDKWLINGKPIDPEKTYTVAFSDYLLKGFDIPFLKPDNKDVLSIYTPAEEELGADIRKTVIAYLKAQN
ncbi:MAG: bifunctional metallophosphatase/5'-nucleotidase [Flavobacteriaceae bacterium]|nr:bifunctional metallophosphatase/5'-nucleotidase [Flavobacteriaceae bacterium]